jgi:hypothetical protein
MAESKPFLQEVKLIYNQKIILKYIRKVTKNWDILLKIVILQIYE